MLLSWKKSLHLFLYLLGFLSLCCPEVYFYCFFLFIFASPYWHAPPPPPEVLCLSRSIFRICIASDILRLQQLRMRVGWNGTPKVSHPVPIVFLLSRCDLYRLAMRWQQPRRGWGCTTSRHSPSCSSRELWWPWTLRQWQFSALPVR